jgi:lysozyme family protein
MEEVFTKVALPLVLRFEGGFVNDPDDRGGATNKGVTQVVYDQYRMDKGRLIRTVKDIENTEVEDIYYNNYWLASKCDKINGKIAIVHFDTCVNSGVKRGCKFLQRAVGAVDDGVIGNVTINLVNKKPVEEVIKSYLEQRVNFYNAIVQKDNSQSKFLKGWLRRVDILRETLAKI